MPFKPYFTGVRPRPSTGPPACRNVRTTRHRGGRQDHRHATFFQMNGNLLRELQGRGDNTLGPGHRLGRRRRYGFDPDGSGSPAALRRRAACVGEQSPARPDGSSAAGDRQLLATGAPGGRPVQRDLCGPRTGLRPDGGPLVDEDRSWRSGTCVQQEEWLRSGQGRLRRRPPAPASQEHRHRMAWRVAYLLQGVEQPVRDRPCTRSSPTRPRATRSTAPLRTDDVRLRVVGDHVGPTDLIGDGVTPDNEARGYVPAAAAAAGGPGDAAARRHRRCCPTDADQRDDAEFYTRS